MPSKRTPNDPIAAARRNSVETRRIGIGRECAFCGENRAAALISGSTPLICAECQRRRSGRSALDDHHVAGKANHPLTLPISANDHRAILSKDQYDWPSKTRENPDNSPLLQAAACIRGFYNTLVYLIEKMLLWIAELLEKMDAFLEAHFGRKWWTKEEFREFVPRQS